MLYLYHYYDEATGPFCNLSDLDPEEAEAVMNRIRTEQKGFASRRPPDYLAVRRSLEQKARKIFAAKGGRPVRTAPHYMTLGECPWLLSWYPRGKELRIPLEALDRSSVSFTYGDLFPTMRVPDGKPYRGQVYTRDELMAVLETYGWPQEWNRDGTKGPERYVEAQIWEEKPLKAHLLR